MRRRGQTKTLTGLLSTATRVRAKLISKWPQRSGAVVESGQDLLLFVGRENQLVPVRVDGETDVVGQLSVAGALQTTGEECYCACGEGDPGNHHPDGLVPGVPRGKQRNLSCIGTI